jgi:hypothetical protein
MAMIERADGHSDHIALKLGEATVRQHQVIDHVDEGLELGCVEGLGPEHVRDEAELFHTLLEVSLQLRRSFACFPKLRSYAIILVLFHAASPVTGAD